MSEIEGEATRVGASERSRGDASDIDGKTERLNGAFWKSDIEGKTARVAASELGKERVSNGRGAHESTQATSEFQSRKREGGRTLHSHHRLPETSLFSLSVNSHTSGK